MEPGFAESHQRVSESGCQFSLSAWFKTGTSSSSAGVKSVRERTAVSATYSFGTSMIATPTLNRDVRLGPPNVSRTEPIF